MPTPQWPASVPQGPFHGYEMADDPAVVSFEVDAGPVKTRPLGTLARRRQSTPYECNGTEKAAIDTFFRSTLRNGTLPFEWIAFDTGTVALVRFRRGFALKWDQVAGAPDPLDRWYRTTLDVEILPS